MRLLRTAVFTIYRVTQACAEHRLDSVKITTHSGFAVSVVLVSGGYPGPYPKGKHIEIADIPSGTQSDLPVFDSISIGFQVLSCSIAELH